MRKIASAAGLRDALANKPMPVGLVPLSFGLHEGHLSLVRRARAECATVVVSLLSPVPSRSQILRERRPHDPENDLALLRATSGVDLVFEYGEFPPPNRCSWVEVGPLGQRWEGLRYPNMFPAVGTMLLDILDAGFFGRLYLGEKDYQQMLVLSELALERYPTLEVIFCATMRELDGLAVGNSNSRLDPEQRSRAGALWRALQRAQALVSSGELRAAPVQGEMLEELGIEGVTPDYAAVVSPETLLPVARIDRPARALIAAYVGKQPANLWQTQVAASELSDQVRLIDNIVLVPPSD